MNIKRIIKKFYIIPSIIIQNFIRTVHKENMYISQANVVSLTHQKTFGEYKNKHEGKEIAIIATGPSLNKYKPIEGVINIGVNKAILCEKFSLDYYFVQDYLACKDYISKLAEYPNIKKFYGQAPTNFYGLKELNIEKNIIPESIILKHNASKYFQYCKYPIMPVFFNTDIDKTWMVCGGSVVFSAIQFALFTNPKRIYLVGCDCSSGHFDNDSKETLLHLIKTWKKLKKFAEIYYPETEIISVNPVGLKGLFKDIIQ